MENLPFSVDNFVDKLLITLVLYTGGRRGCHGGGGVGVTLGGGVGVTPRTFHKIQPRESKDFACRVLRIELDFVENEL